MIVKLTDLIPDLLQSDYRIPDKSLYKLFQHDSTTNMWSIPKKGIDDMILTAFTIYVPE